MDIQKYCDLNKFSLIPYGSGDDFVSHLIEQCLLDNPVWTDNNAVATVIMNQSLSYFPQIYFNITDVSISVSLFQQFSDLVILRISYGNRVFLARFDLKDYHSFLDLNNTEIFQGQQFVVQKRDVDWRKQICSWVKFHCSVGDTIESVSICRTRSIVHTRYTVISGYTCYVHVFEERKSHYIIEVRSDSFKDKIYKVEVSPKFLADSLDKYDTVEINSIRNGANIPCILCDRLTITPEFKLKGARRFRSDRLRLGIRQNRGPGRIMGRRLLQLDRHLFLLSAFELTNDDDTYPLRISLYHPPSSQQKEFSISALERELFFDSNTSGLLVDILIARFRLVNGTYQGIDMLQISEGNQAFVAFDRSIAKIQHDEIEAAISLMNCGRRLRLSVFNQRYDVCRSFEMDREAVTLQIQENSDAVIQSEAAVLRRECQLILENLHTNPTQTGFYSLTLGDRVLDFDFHSATNNSVLFDDFHDSEHLIESTECNNRVCWRGLLDCTKFQLSIADRPEIFSRREQRIHYLPALGKAEFNSRMYYFSDGAPSNDLVIVVEEILTPGLSLVKKQYCLGLYTHFGLLISKVSIDGDDELRQIAGPIYSQKMNDRNFNASNMFSFIVKEKLHLYVIKNVAEGQSLQQLRGCLGIRFLYESRREVSKFSHDIRNVKALITRRSADRHSLIIHTQILRCIGKSFKVIVILVSKNKDIFYDYYKFFSRQRFQKDQIQELLIIFKFIDLHRRQSAVLELELSKLMVVIDDHFDGDVNLSFATKRSKFAVHLLSFVEIFYREDGIFDLRFANVSEAAAPDCNMSS